MRRGGQGSGWQRPGYPVAMRKLGQSLHVQDRQRGSEHGQEGLQGWGEAWTPTQAEPAAR